MSDKIRVTRYLPEIRYLIRGTLHENRLVAEIEAFAVVATDPALLFEGVGSHGDPRGWTEDVGKAAVYLHGGIKWDGCSNLLFNENAENCCLHFCGRRDASNVGVLLGAMYDLAREMIGDEWDDNEPVTPGTTPIVAVVGDWPAAYEAARAADPGKPLAVLVTSGTPSAESGAWLVWADGRRARVTRATDYNSFGG